MQLSDIKGERTLDVVADLMAAISRIAMDPEAADCMKRKPLPKGMSPEEYGYRWLAKACDKLIKPHKKDVISMLATIKGVSAKEYTKNLDIPTLVADLTDLMNDPMFSSLFFSAAQSKKTSSGSASEITEAPQA